MADPLIPLVTRDEVILNAGHLILVSEDAMNHIINSVHMVFIYDFYKKYQTRDGIPEKLKFVEELLVQHMATLNVRRADSESVPQMSKSISVPKDLDLDQTEYGQMAKKIGKQLGLSWASDQDEPASVVIYDVPRRQRYR